MMEVTDVQTIPVCLMVAFRRAPKLNTLKCQITRT